MSKNTIEENEVRYPFGNPEGGSEDLENFIDLGDQFTSHGLTYSSKNLKAKVIVGRKGAGKTFLHKKMETEAVDWRDVICVRAKRNRLEPAVVRTFAQDMSDDEDMASKWMNVWRRGIFYSVATQLFCSGANGLQEYNVLYPSISKVIKKEKRRFDEHFRYSFQGKLDFTFPKGIYSAVSHICGLCHNHEEFYKFSILYPWDNLETFIIEVMRQLPPLVYYLDAIDDDFKHAPSAYLDCQKGLYYAVKELYQTNSVNDKLHVIITLRDLVFSAAIDNEHRTKQLGNAKIKHLRWSNLASKEFILRKIIRIKEGFKDSNGMTLRKGFAFPDERDPILSFFGMTKIRNEARGLDEDIIDYIVRHTNNMPRQLVAICNRIFSKIWSINYSKTELEAKHIRKAVSEYAAEIAKESLAISGNFIASSVFSLEYINDSFDLVQEVKGDSISGRRDRYYTYESQLASLYKDIVRDLIMEVGKDCFTFDVLQEHLTEFTSLVSDAESTRYKMNTIENVLWNQGLLGYREYDEHGTNSIDHFYTDAESSKELYLPVNKEIYVFHPCLIDLLKIECAGERPVGGAFNHE